MVPTGSGLRVSGFGTLGVVHANAPAGWGFLRSIDQAANDGGTRADIDSRIGLQLNYSANSQFELVGQRLAARRANNAPANSAVEWAFAAYRPTSDITLRVGRLNVDQFVMSDYRNVGFAYLYVRPPVEFYGLIPTSLDGADLSRTWNGEDSHWRAKAFGGRAKISGVDLTQVFGLTLAREAGGLLVRAGLSRAKFPNGFPGAKPLLDGLDQLRALPIPSIAAEASTLRTRLDYAGTSLMYATLGATYEQAQWQWAAELTRASAGPSAAISAGYASVARRFDPVTLFGIASGATSNASVLAMPAWGAMLAPIFGPVAAQQAQGLAQVATTAVNRTMRQSTYSLGARWDIHPQVALKLQWDHVRILANGAQLWSNATASPGRADLATVTMDFVF